MCYPLAIADVDEYCSLTERLQQFAGGQRDIAEAVLNEVLPALRQIAAHLLNRERYAAPLSPTELINEVWLRSLGRGGWLVESREHFYNIAALAMRHVLIDFARSRLAERRGSGEASLPLSEIPAGREPALPHPEVLIEVGILMDQLEKTDPKAAQVVDLHYFLGCSLREIAGINRLTFRQTRKRWDRGNQWLKSKLKGYRSRT